MNLDILVYSQQLTPRVKYSLNLILRDILKLAVSFTDIESEFEEYNGPKFSYSYRPTGNALNFVPYGLLFERGIEQFEVPVFATDKGIGLFRVNDSQFPFDLFSATFYLATRYEEYLPHVKDKHGRFSAKHSLAYNADFLGLPVINIWAFELKEILEKKFESLRFKKLNFQIVPTIDVDSAFAYKEKGIVRTVVGISKDIIQTDFVNLKKRLSTLIGNSEDPFEVFDQLIAIQRKFEMKFVYFFLVGDYDKNDKSVSITSRKFQAVIKHVNDYSFVGLHPSFASNDNSEKLAIELTRLSKVLHYPVKYSRQHFLKLHLPDTYRNLMDLEITDDFSMGYPDHSGFRASICTPYYFYDLELEIETNLLLHPFCFMEATYKYYHPAEPESILVEALKLAKEVRKVDGEFCFVWHSDSLSQLDPWQGWQNLLSDLLQSVKEL